MTPETRAQRDGIREVNLLDVLDAIEAIVGDDACCEWAMENALRKFRGRPSDMLAKLTEVYKLAHGFNTRHSCHHVHTDWRKGLTGDA